MSGTNAPQPSASGPAETFDSSITSQEQPVSSVNAGQPTGAEAVQHTGASNGIDEYLRKQYIATATLAWNVNQNAGTLLYKKAIHPGQSHQWMQHLSRMYNTFTGGFDFCVKVAGTGFHAGAVMVVRIPPNIDPSALRSISDITAFEYFVIDPKTLEVEAKEVMDQRNILFHYMPLDTKNPQTFGGWFCIYVLIPLNTSSTGATKINLQVFEKPSKGFEFHQLKPLELANTPTYPIEFNSVLHFHNDGTLFNTTKSCRSIQIDANPAALYADAVCYTVGLNSKDICFPDVNMRPLSGDMAFSPAVFKDKFLTVSGALTQTKVVNGGIVQFVSDIGTGLLTRKEVPYISAGNDNYYKPKYYPRIYAVIDTKKAWIFGVSEPNNDGICVPLTVQSLPECAAIVSSIENTGFKDLITASVSLDVNTFYAPSGFSWAPPLRESIMWFSNSRECRSTQTSQIALFLKSNPIDIAEGDTLVYEFIDDATGLPLFPVRVHSNGIFTTTVPSTNRSFNLHRHYSLSYVASIPATVPLQSAVSTSRTTYAINRAALRLESSHIENELENGSSSRDD